MTLLQTTFCACIGAVIDFPKLARRPAARRVLAAFLAAGALGLRGLAAETDSIPGPPAVDLGALDLLGIDAPETEAVAIRELDPDAAEPVVPLSSTGGAQPAGRWRFSPHFDARVTYDDNIFISNRDPVRDWIFTAAPGVSFGFGDSNERFESFLYRDRRASRAERPEGNFLTADYTASLLGFARTDSENMVNHDARIEAQWETGKLQISGAFSFQDGTAADIDIGGRVQRRVYTASVGVKYQVMEKVSLETTLRRTISEPADFITTKEWTSENWINYLATPLVTVGLGGVFGQLEIEGASDEQYEQALLRLGYSATEKLSFEARGGVEFRQRGEGLGDKTTPVFGAGLKFSPLERTTIALEGFRRTEYSGLERGRDFTLTGAALRLKQSIGRGFHLTLDGGYEVSDYTESVDGRSRTDDYFFVRPGVLYNIARWGNAQLHYLHREDRSTQESFSFLNNQVEFELSLIF